jgi:hypothetical protein
MRLSPRSLLTPVRLAWGPREGAADWVWARPRPVLAVSPWISLAVDVYE